jgi:NAD(P)H-hydrate epimerase
MAQADARAIEGGIDGYDLMLAAGAAVAHEIHRRWPAHPVVIACGSGGNGGDGLVAARALEGLGHAVRLVALRPAGRADVAAAHRDWKGETQAPAALDALVRACVTPPVLVDALLGTGMSRPLSGALEAVLQSLSALHSEGLATALVSVDLPSGLDADGAAAPTANQLAADLTVAFHAHKPAHLLAPHRSLCGEVVIHPIGLPGDSAQAVGVQWWLNEPRLWARALPVPNDTTHKHTRGKVAVWASGPGGQGALTLGAPRLAALAAARAGSGWTSLVGDAGDWPDLASSIASLAGLPASLLVRFHHDAQALADEFARHSACVVGPSAGTHARRAALVALEHAPACVLDADALSAFAGDPDTLFGALALHRERTGDAAVLTPHAGEFARLFADLTALAPLERALAAARRSGAVVVLKGASTLIATPEGQGRLNAHAAPWLASAGTGDVLAGVVASLMAQGMTPFDAASAGVWVHGEAGRSIGRGLIADDLPGALASAFATAIEVGGS